MPSLETENEWMPEPLEFRTVLIGLVALVHYIDDFLLVSSPLASHARSC